MTAQSNAELDLLNNFVHDLKTPLAAVKSYVELVEHSGDLNDKQKHFADRALGGVERMQLIIDELLDFARLEADVALQFEACDLLDAVQQATNLLENMASEKGVSVSIEIPTDVQFVSADAQMLNRALSNLISNAIKYNQPDGEVRVIAQEAGDYVRVEVVDTGLGIPEEALLRVFERFYRVEHNSSERIEGTGLGLPIVKTIIERHGGKISVESTPKEGSIFSFTIPRATTIHPDTDREIADDMDDSQQEMREELDDSDSQGDIL